MADANRGRNDSRRLSWPGLITLLTLLFMSLCGPLSDVSYSADAPSQNSTRLIQFLVKTIEWYHQMSLEQQIATEPNDVVNVNDNRQITDQVVRLSFEFARAEADQAASEIGAGTTESKQFQALTQLSARLDENIHELQGELESLRRKLETAAGRTREAVRNSLAETQSELDLANARKEAVASMLQFVGGAGANGPGGTGLRAQVDAMARSLPAALTNPPSDKNKSAADQQTPATPPVSISPHREPTGIWELSSDLFALNRKQSILRDSVRLTDGLTDAAEELRAPLMKRLRELSNQGDEVAKQADTANPSTLVNEKKQLDELTGDFKRITARMLPLSKMNILLGLYRKNLTDWQSAIGEQSSAELRSLLLRLGMLAVVLGIVIVLSAIWRRAIIRYVHDTRRRYQLLLLRRIIVWLVIVVIITVSFASQLTSIATFAGLMTAGVAVALQSVILSIVGYFFLIGKYGVRVGDRVQIAQVTGEVIEIGLVRLHLMELGAKGANPPTGRVVAFPNSIVFQADAGLFKQIPGTNFIWHEIALTFSASSDWPTVEQRVQEATDAVFKDYGEDLQLQHREMSRSLKSTSVDALQPRIQLHFVAAGLEVVVRYPVDLRKSAEIDGRMTQEILKAIRREPRLKLAGSEAESVTLKTELVSSKVT